MTVKSMKSSEILHVPFCLGDVPITFDRIHALNVRSRIYLKKIDPR